MRLQTLQEALQNGLNEASPQCKHIVVLQFLRPKALHFAILGATLSETRVYSISSIYRTQYISDLPDYAGPTPLTAKHLVECGIDTIPDCYSAQEEDFPAPYVAASDIAEEWLQISSEDEDPS
jgi:hypothetical protein